MVGGISLICAIPIKPMFPSVGSRHRQFDLTSCLAGSDTAWNRPGAALPLYLESEV